MNSALRACEAAVILVTLQVSGWVRKKPGTLQNHNIHIFLINKIDKENVDVDKIVADLKAKFGTSLVV